MSSNSRPPRAVVVLPPVRNGVIDDPGLRRWLSKGDWHSTSRPSDMLHVVAQRIDCRPVPAGLAALRLWGQTGERSSAWMMAADPVYLEARLDHLCTHSLVGETTRAELRSLFEDLQSDLGSEYFSFAKIGDYGYVRSEEALETTPYSAAAVDGLRPDEYLPKNDRLHRVLSEVQMFLHDHHVNAERARRGLRPVNSLWFWGGGVAPELSAAPVLPLFSDDPLFRGLWFSHDVAARPWSDDFGAMVESAEHGFVAVSPESLPAADGHVANMLDALRRLLHAKRIGRLVLCFRDGMTVELRRSDRLRFWRGQVPFLEQG